MSAYAVILEEIMRKFSYVFVVVTILLVAVSLCACGQQNPTEPSKLSQVVEGMDDFYYFADDNSVLLIGPKDKSLTSVTIPSCVTTITGGAFEDCTALQEVVFASKSKLKEVQTAAFKNCIALKSISLPSSVKIVGNEVFSGCSSIESIDFNTKGLTDFGTLVFKNCSGLKSVVVPSQVSVTEKEFEGCASLSSVVLSEGITSIGDKAFYGRAIKSLTLPSSLVSVGANAFYGNKLSGDIVFPDGLKTIGARAFFGNEFSGIILPTSVDFIGNSAFACGLNLNLEKITLPFIGNTKGGGRLTDVLGERDFSQLKIRVLGGKLTAEMLVGLENATIEISKDVDVKAGSLDDTQWFANKPDGIVYIGDVVYGYKGEAVSSLSIKEGTTKILDEAFLNYHKSFYSSSIQPYLRLYLPSTLSEMGKKNFFAVPLIIVVSDENPVYKSEYYSLLSKDGKKLILSGLGGGVPGVETICEYAGITLADIITSFTITIPNSVKYIERFAFPSSKVEFESGSNLISVGDYAFCFMGETSESTVLDLSALGKLESIGKNAFGIGGAPSDILVDEFGINNSIGDYVSVVETVKLPKNLKSIGAYAFGNNLKNIQLNSENETYNIIDNCLIQNSTVVLGTVESVIPERYTNGSGNEVVITSIGDYAFAGLDVSKIVIPASVESIGKSAFESCKGLSSIVFSSNIKSIGDDAFKNTALQNVAFDEDSKLENIGARAFYGTQIESIAIPSFVRSIGASAFEGTRLTAITIPSYVKSIASRAFANTNLEQLYFETRIRNEHAVYDLKEIDFSAFSIGRMPQLKTLSAPAGVIEKIKDAFSSIETVYIIGEDDVPDELFMNATVGNVIVGEGVKKIGSQAFCFCSVEKISLPASLTEIGFAAFGGLKSTQITLASGNKKYYIQNNYVIDLQNHAIVVAFSDSGEIPTTFTWVNNGDKDVKSYDVTSIASGAFLLVRLQRLVIPGNVKVVDNAAFIGSLVEEVVLEEGVERIGTEAFFYSYYLQTVVVPNSIKYIGKNAFAKTKFYTELAKNAQDIIYVGKFAYDYVGSRDVEQLQIKDGTKGIVEQAFENLVHLKKVMLPSSVKSIGKYAFYGCINVADIYFNATDSDWEAMDKATGWNANMSSHRTWVICDCQDRTHDHDDDGVVKEKDEPVDACKNYKLRKTEICDECLTKEVDKTVSEKSK